jgi:hypothetical protein
VIFVGFVIKKLVSFAIIFAARSFWHLALSGSDAELSNSETRKATEVNLRSLGRFQVVEVEDCHLTF